MSKAKQMNLTISVFHFRICFLNHSQYQILYQPDSNQKTTLEFQLRNSTYRIKQMIEILEDKQDGEANQRLDWGKRPIAKATADHYTSLSAVRLGRG